MVFTQVTARGANMKSLVTNNETEFKFLNFRAYQKILKLSQPNENREKNSSSERRSERDTSYSVFTPLQKPFELGQAKSKFASIRFGK
jgi:hypothetical protein